MALSLVNNVPSMTAQHNLGRSTTALNRSLERLSSGLKINRGADGPAALVISEKQRVQISGLNQAIENTERAVAVVQTAEGALNEIASLLMKIRSLGLDSANTGVNDADAQAANQAEIDNALDTIDRIANNTQFGTKRLLDGSAGIDGTATIPAEVTFLKGTSDTTAGNHDVTITTVGERAEGIAAAAQDSSGTLAADEILTINNVTVTLAKDMSQTEVINRINDFTAQTGVIADRLAATGETRVYSVAFGPDETLSVVSDTAAAATSSGFGTTTITGQGANVVGTIGGTSFTGQGNVLTANSDVVKGISIQFAADTGANAHLTVAVGAHGSVNVVDNSMVFQIGPNQNQTADLAVDKVNPNALGISVSGNQFANLAEIVVTSAAQAQDAIGIIDEAIDEVANLRGTLGAFQQNTLESTANNLRATLENTVNAESIIRDTDFADEISNFTQKQVLTQAGTSILSSANQQAQLVLSLLS